MLQEHLTNSNPPRDQMRDFIQSRDSLGGKVSGHKEREKAPALLLADRRSSIHVDANALPEKDKDINGFYDWNKNVVVKAIFFMPVATQTKNFSGQAKCF